MVKWPPTRGWKGHKESPGYDLSIEQNLFLSEQTLNFKHQLQTLDLSPQARLRHDMKHETWKKTWENANY